MADIRASTLLLVLLALHHRRLQPRGAAATDTAAVYHRATTLHRIPLHTEIEGIGRTEKGIEIGVAEGHQVKAIVNAATAVNEAIAKTVVIVVTVAAAEAAAATAIVRLSIIIRRHLPLATAEAVKTLRIQHLAASHRLRVAEVGAR